MAEIINLRRARKAKARDAAAAAADVNRAKYGRTKGEKAGQKAESARGKKHLDQSRLDSGENSDQRKPR
jgi:Domain of unknown function (DUF4169)